MSRQTHDDEIESESFLVKSDRRRQRLDRSEKARIHRKRRQAKQEREYEDGFGGNYD